MMLTNRQTDLQSTIPIRLDHPIARVQEVLKVKGCANIGRREVAEEFVALGLSITMRHLERTKESGDPCQSLVTGISQLSDILESRPNHMWYFDRSCRGCIATNREAFRFQLSFLLGKKNHFFFSESESLHVFKSESLKVQPKPSHNKLHP